MCVTGRDRDCGRRDACGAGVGSGLEHVLELQSQLWRQPTEVDACFAEAFAVCGELVDLGTTGAAPPQLVRPAEYRPRVLDPQVAERHSTSGVLAVTDRSRPGRPDGGIGPARSFPSLPMPVTQSLPGGAVAAVGDSAVAQPRPAPQRWPRIDEKLRQRRPTLITPSKPMPVADPVIGDRVVTAGNRAVGHSQHGILGRRREHIDPELWAHHGQQLFQQSGAVTSAAYGRDHSRTSRPVNQPAASRVWRASSTVR